MKPTRLSRRTPMPRSTKPMKRGQIKRKRRDPEDFARIYGSKERVAFVKSLPCAFCKHRGHSENAHVGGNGGMGRKGPYTEIAPLCGPWSGLTSEGPLNHPGCHRLFDERRWPMDSEYVREVLAASAATTEALWLSHLAAKEE